MQRVLALVSLIAFATTLFSRAVEPTILLIADNRKTVAHTPPCE
jgi:hypothetical protein